MLFKGMWLVNKCDLLLIYKMYSVSPKEINIMQIYILCNIIQYVDYSEIIIMQYIISTLTIMNGSLYEIVVAIVDLPLRR